MFKISLIGLTFFALPISMAQDFPVTVEHKYGSTTIPAAPKRIVTLGFNDQDAVYVVGQKPIAVRYWFDESPTALYPWSEALAGEPKPQVLNMPELNMEAILALDPDLITALYEEISQEEYRQLSEIAPTLVQSGKYGDDDAPWQEMTVDIGTALGSADAAEAAVSEVEGAFAQARADHPEFEGKSIVVLLTNPEGGFWAYPSDNNRSRIFTNLGFSVPDFVDELPEYGMLSQERYDLLEQDVIVVLEDQPGARARLDADPLFNKLKVVQEGRAVIVGGVTSLAVAFNTVLSLPYALEGFLPDLTAAVSRLE